MTTLEVGVLDVPHLGDGITTGDLAEILEAKYLLFLGFVEVHMDQIANAMADSVHGAIDTILSGHQPQNIYADATEEIRAMFLRFLDSGEVERIGMIGVPTAAALKGVNRRLKRRKGQRRNSFIDSGLLRATVMAWIEQDGASFGMSKAGNAAQAKDMSRAEGA